MLNEEIVRAGYANLLTHPPDVNYQERFLMAYREARENKEDCGSKDWQDDAQHSEVYVAKESGIYSIDRILV
jgi:hypothetical protein